MQLQNGYEAFAERNTQVVAVAQEDTDLEKHAQFLQGLEERRFEIVADLNRAETKVYDRTTAYLIDREGKVRQIFPMLIHTRPDWRAIVAEIDRLELR